MSDAAPQRRPDPISTWVGGMRRVAHLDLGEVARGLANLGNPDANFLDMLGRDREERVEKMASMLRNASPAEMEEMGTVYALAMARVAEERDGRTEDQSPGRDRLERPRRRRGQTAAEWRRERRRAS